MPRRQTHASIGLIIPISIYLLLGTKIFNSTFLISSALFVLGNLAPDILEPSRYFTHRDFFHSWKLLKILSISIVITVSLWIISWLIFKTQFFLFILSFILGYIIHLLMDSTTKLGLPKDNNPIGFKPDRF
jgi:hypothetical protein